MGPTFLSLLFFISYFFYFGLGNDCILTIEQSGFINGRVIDAHPNVNLDDCVRECSHHKNCGGANFVIDVHERPTCLLMDMKRKATESETPSNRNVIYAIHKICGKYKIDNKKCINQSPWSFERFPQYRLKNETFIIQTLNDIEIDECLRKCSKQNECAAAIFSPKDKICKVSRVSFHNVNSIQKYFEFDYNSDVYEFDCINRTYDADNCNYLRVNRAGFTNIYDARLAAANRTACENICLNSLKFSPTSKKISASACRAYTFDSHAGLCYISHFSQRAFGRNALDNANVNLSYGDLENCVQFNLDCMARSLILRGKSLKLFHGVIGSKQDKQYTCLQNVTESYEFSAEFSFKDCHLHREANPHPVYSSLLTVKEGTTDLITIHDKMIQVSCRLHQQHAHKSVYDTLNLLQNHSRIVNLSIPNSPLVNRMLVDELIRQHVSTTYRPTFALEVLDRTGRTANTVDINDRGYLQIKMLDNSTDQKESNMQFFTISNLIAESVSENKSITLIDSSGCVANTELIKSLKRIAKNKLQIEIIFNGFKDQSRVTYQTLVKRCVFNCFLECNRNYFKEDPYFNEYYGSNSNRSIETRSRRDATIKELRNEVKRHFKLNEELHELYWTVIQTKQGKNTLNVIDKPADSFREVREKIRYDFLHCLEEVNCALMLLFVTFQLIMLAIFAFFVAALAKKIIDRVLLVKNKIEINNSEK